MYHGDILASADAARAEKKTAASGGGDGRGPERQYSSCCGCSQRPGILSAKKTKPISAISPPKKNYLRRLCTGRG